MALRVDEIQAAAWALFSRNAHMAVFAYEKPATVDRIDYALLVVDTEKDTPVAYVTVRELDHESVYWQFGGGFKWAQKSILMARAYDKLLEHQSRKSKRMVTRIENTNAPMLKLALSRGLQIYGVRAHHDHVLVELEKEWTNEHNKNIFVDVEPEVSLIKERAKAVRDKA